MASHESDYAYTPEPEQQEESLDLNEASETQTPKLLEDADLSPENLALVKALEAQAEGLVSEIKRIDAAIDKAIGSLKPIEDKVRSYYFQIEDIKASVALHSPYKLTDTDREIIANLTTRMSLEVSHYRHEKIAIEKTRLVPLRRERFVFVEQLTPLLRQIEQLRTPQ